jgi:hypothetical protein
MSRVALAMLMLAAVIVASAPRAMAADTTVKAAPVVVEHAPDVATPIYVEKAPENIFEKPTLVPKPPARVQYGCKRVWRCDTVVCEWRRGCWGVYGYMEGPYYTEELAKRQWARDGLPVAATPTPRRRTTVEPSLK